MSPIILNGYTYTQPADVQEEKEVAEVVEKLGAGERTRTSDLLITNHLPDKENKEHKPLTSANHGKVRQNPQPIRNQIPDKNNPEGGES